MLRTHACSSKVVGHTLATQLSRRVLSEVAELPVTRILTPEQVLQGLKEDVVSHLALQNAPAELGPSEFETPPKKARRAKASIHEMLEAKTRQCLWILENRLAVFRADSVPRS